jgi:hypothetical protein
MFTHVRIRRGRWLAFMLGLLTLATTAQAQLQQVPLRGPPLSSRPPNQQIMFTDPNTGLMINTIVPPHVSLMPGSNIVPLNNGSLGNYPIQGLPGAQNNFVFAYPPEMSGFTGIGGGGGIGGGIGGIGGGVGGIGGGVGGIGGGIGGIGGGIGGLGGGIGGIGGGIGGIGGGIGGLGGGLGGGVGGFGGGIGGFGGVFGTRTFLGGPSAGYTGFGGNFSGFGGAIGAVGGGF